MRAAWVMLNKEIEAYRTHLDFVPEILEKREQEQKKISKLLAQLQPSLRGRANQDKPWVQAKASGPKGGDVEIAKMILERKCNRILFFEDPDVSREHETDIQLLERASRIPELEVTCLHDIESSARMGTLMQNVYEKGYGKPRNSHTGISLSIWCRASAGG